MSSKAKPEQVKEIHFETVHTFPVISSMTESTKPGLDIQLTPLTIKFAGGVVLQNTLDQFLYTSLPVYLPVGWNTLNCMSAEHKKSGMHVTYVIKHLLLNALSTTI